MLNVSTKSLSFLCLEDNSGKVWDTLAIWNKVTLFTFLINVFWYTGPVSNYNCLKIFLDHLTWSLILPTVQIVLKWFKERRWKVWEWVKNEREEWRGRKGGQGVKEDGRGRTRLWHAEGKRLRTHSEVGKRCSYLQSDVCSCYLCLGENTPGRRVKSKCLQVKN